MINVSPAELLIIGQILADHVPHAEVWAFGSRTSGNARRYSDLDLAIVAPTPLPLDARAALAEAFSDSDLPFRVDIVDWATTTEAFRHVIDAGKSLLQAAPARERPSAG